MSNHIMYQDVSTQGTPYSWLGQASSDDIAALINERPQKWTE
jgi:hypothetical protein